MTVPGSSVTLFGRGWGHGVGLSQYGARGRAFAGQDAATILAHYYPGTTLGSIPTTTQVRVLLVDDLVPTVASPLAVTARGGAWTIDGVPGTFPADARLRLMPDDRGHRPRPGASWSTTQPARCATGAAPSDLRRPSVDRGHHVPASGRVGDVRPVPGPAARHPDPAHGSTSSTSCTIEAYLRGVVPAEMPSSWPTPREPPRRSRPARTRRAASGPVLGTFDVYDDTRSQVYRGVRVEAAAADDVIADTAGRVLRSGTTRSRARSSTRPAAARRRTTRTSSSRRPGPGSPARSRYLRGSADRDPKGQAYDAGVPLRDLADEDVHARPALGHVRRRSATSVGTLKAHRPARPRCLRAA